MYKDTVLGIDTGLYIIEFEKSMGLEMGKEIKGGKKTKKGNLGKI